jgi:hypothetical protein
VSAPGADSGALDAGAVDTGAADEQPPPWLGQIHERMDELRESTGLIAQQMADLQGGYDDEYTDDELEQLDGYGQFLREHGDELDEIAGEYDDAGDNEQPDLIDQLTDRMDRAIERRESAADAETAVEDRDLAFDDLRESMPLLQDDRTARELIERATRRAVRLCHQLGRDPEDLIGTPDFVRIIEAETLAHIGRQARAREHRETSGASREVQLESAAGAGAPPRSKEPDWGERIVAAAERVRPKI